MKIDNKEMIAKLHEKRGEQKHLIAMYVICAVLSLAVAIFLFCYKEWSNGFASILFCILFINNAISQKDCYDCNDALISALEVIDILSNIHVELEVEEQKPEDETPSES